MATETPEREECKETSTGQASMSTAPPSNNPLPVRPRCQEGFYSCWSTCTEMILEFVGGGRVRQCDQSNQAFNRMMCCGQNGLIVRDPGCDRPWVPDFEQWGYECDYLLQVPLAWNQVTAEINAGRPFAFAWTPVISTVTASGLIVNQPGQISHMMVLIGYGVDAQSNLPVVTYLDPSPTQQSDAMIVSFADYDGSSGLFVHAEDYFNIRPQ